MLIKERELAQRAVKTDAYQMSVGEIVSMYDERELVIDPEFQRLFRWGISQKSKLIESILLGIPLPPIFVFEAEDGTWELIDGLQRLSTLLEFMGKLRQPQGLEVPSILEATKYLPSLHNTVWEPSEAIRDVAIGDQVPIDKTLQLAIRRARISVEILKRPSDTLTKFDLFQRLNAGGTQANAQELRNCIILMVNTMYYRAIKVAADSTIFQKLLGVTEEQTERQRHMELATRLLVHTLIPYDGALDVEEYIDEGIVQLAGTHRPDDAEALIGETIRLIELSVGDDGLRRFEDGRYTGKIGLVSLEGIVVGVAKNLQAISALSNSLEFLRAKIQLFWSQPETTTFTSPGLRGTTRIQRTVPFGERWFAP